MKKVAIIFICMAVVLSLCTGCWDYTEVNMQDYVFGLSVDKQGDEYSVCIETLEVKGSPEEGSSAGIVTKTRGTNLFDAIRSAITHAGKKLYWGHFQLAIIGESVAKEELAEILDVFSRAQDVYLNVAVVVARGTPAEDVLSAKLPKSTMVTDHIMDIFDNQKPSRHFNLTEIWQLYRTLSFSDSFILPTVTLNDDIPQLNGSAVFNAGKLTGFLTGDETVIYSLLTENSPGGYLPDIQVTPELNVSLEISQNLISTKAEFKDGKPEIKIKSEISVSLSRTSGKCNLMDENTQAQIGAAAQRAIYARMQALTERIRTEALGDILNWSHAIEVASPEWWRKNSSNRENILKSVPINWDVRVSLNSAGMTKHTLTFN